MPDPKAPDDNPLKKEIDNVSKFGRGLLKNSAPSKAAEGADNLRKSAMKKLGFGK